MVETRTYNVLVAEDETFQRLALFDLLSNCDYEVENGKLALEALRNPDYDFDLVLLDLNMPEIDGFEVLQVMRTEENLKQIPVVIMSSNEAKEIIADCIKQGAKNFIVKPMRMQQCKSLINYMRKREPKSEEDAEVEGLAKYEVVKFLGQGAAGSVQLMRNKKDDLLYAVKTVNLNLMSDKDRRSAEAEAQFLRVLSGPTLITSSESFIDKGNLYIAMEFAENGSLAQRIEQFKIQGKKFDKDNILEYLAMMTLGLMAMHMKNIIHRDFKTQNIFITKDEILKIGDFGISRVHNSTTAKEMTACGTPYFMPPEVILGKPYDNKADVWALGVILYELVTFRKPFDDENIPMLFEKITKHPHDPFPQEVDSDLKMIVNMLLNKEFRKRPTAFELAQIPCMQKAIQKFVEKHELQEQVMEVFTVLKPKPQKPTENGGLEPTVKGFLTSEEQIEEVACLIRNDVSVRDIKTGWFTGYYYRCAIGKDIEDWIFSHVTTDPNTTKTILHQMIKFDKIRSVNGGQDFSDKSYYQFYMDRDDMPDNCIRLWKGEVNNPLEVSVSLVKMMEDIYSKSLIENDEEDEPPVIDAAAVFKSTEFGTYQTKASELSKVDLSVLNQNQLAAFFINVYQCMYCHYLFRMVFEGKGPGAAFSWFQTMKSFIQWESSKPFFYTIAGKNFSIDELKHGVLRNNVKCPLYYFRSLSATDERTLILKDVSLYKMIMQFHNPKVNFICFDFPSLVLNILAFEDERVDAMLDKACSDYIVDKVNVDTMTNEITMPKILQIYQADFGGSEEAIIRFAWQYLQEEMEVEQAIREVCVKKSMMIKYE